MSDYAVGGLIQPGFSWVRIDPDECIVRANDVRAGRWRCSRADHPTDTSDCSKVSDT